VDLDSLLLRRTAILLTACLHSLVVARKARQGSILRQARHSTSVGTSLDLRLTVSFTLFLSFLEGCDPCSRPLTALFLQG
jgi:hypothetical protein